MLSTKDENCTVAEGPKTTRRICSPLKGEKSNLFQPRICRKPDESHFKFQSVITCICF